MKRFTALTGVVLLLGFASVAYAAQLLSPPLSTGAGTSGACYIRNTGNKPVSVAVSIFSDFGLTVNFDNCNGAPLGAGRTCVLLVDDLPDNAFVACSATSGAVAKLRGTLEVREIAPVPQGAGLGGAPVARHTLWSSIPEVPRFSQKEIAMKALRVMAACVGVLVFSGSADAATLFSPSIFGAHSQDRAHCVVVNGGTTIVSVVMRIVDESGGTVASRPDVIHPGGFASVDSFIPFGVAHACVVTTSDPVVNLRAAITIVERIGFTERPLRSASLR